MLNAALALLLLTGFYPLGRAWRDARGTTIRHAVGWTMGAWAAWVAAAYLGPASVVAGYVALCLTACASVAVLGARRPIVGAWNAVVLSLLAVLLWPIAEGMGAPRLNEFNTTLLGAALAVGLLNYLPTRLAPAVLTAGIACVIETAIVLKTIGPAWGLCRPALLAVAPWLGLAATPRPAAADPLDREWRAFRDRFGAVWALPARDQFNRASANGDWGFSLEWHGSRPVGGAARHAEAVAGLRALLKRFGPEGATS